MVSQAELIKCYHSLVSGLISFHVAAHYDGTVYWIYPGTQESYCQLDLRNFPFDQQTCPMKFGSWSYDGSKLDIINRSASGDISMFASNGEWDVVGMPLKRHVIYYGCCPSAFPDVTFWLVIRRKPLYYTFNLVLPGVVTKVLPTLVFFLPPESGEKMSLSVTLMLAMTVFLLLICENMPSQSNVVPFLCK